MLAIITIVEIIKKYKLWNNQTIVKQKIINKNFDTTNIENIVKCIVIIIKVKSFYNKTKQKKSNEFAHCLNGNREKETIYNHYEFMNFNKGNRDYKTYSSELRIWERRKKLI